MTCLFPNKNHYSNGQIENQAIFGYTCKTVSSQEDNMVHVMMTFLEAGKAAFWLRNEMVIANIQVINETGGYFDRRRDIKLADMRLLGDPATRLKSVYTGTTGAPIGSIRIISNG